NLIDENKKRLEENMELYRKRQAIVEHPFGIIKRQWGFYYIMTKKSIKHAQADVGMIFTAYNLRRIFNLIPEKELKKYFQKITKGFNLFYSIKLNLKLSHLRHSFNFEFKPQFYSKMNYITLNSFVFSKI